MQTVADDVNLTVEILKQIRDEVRQTNERLDRTNERLDQVVHEQIHHATAIASLERGQRELTVAVGKVVDAIVALDHRQEATLVELRQLNARIDNVLTGPLGKHVRTTTERVDALEVRVEALERRAG